MAGRGFIKDVTPIYNKNIKMLRNGRWQMMTEPIHFDREVSGIGPAASFAAAWQLDHVDEEIGLIPCAEGGSSISEWGTDQKLMRHAISEARFAMEDSELIGILWHQGENDSLNEHYKNYDHELMGVFSNLRTALGLPEVPIIFGKLPEFLGKKGFGTSAIEFEQINQAMQKVNRQLNNTYLVSAEDLDSNPDGIHINARSQRRFGLRYYAAFKNKSNIDHPLNDEHDQLDRIDHQPQDRDIKTYLLSRELILGKISYPTFTDKIEKLMHEPLN